MKIEPRVSTKEVSVSLNFFILHITLALLVETVHDGVCFTAYSI